MKRNVHSAFGAMHPAFFLIVLYSIALFLALFVCRTVYYSVNSNDGITVKKVVSPSLNNAADTPNVLTAAVYK